MIGKIRGHRASVVRKITTPPLQYSVRYHSGLPNEQKKFYRGLMWIFRLQGYTLTAIAKSFRLKPSRVSFLTSDLERRIEGAMYRFQGRKDSHIRRLRLVEAFKSQISQIERQISFFQIQLDNHIYMAELFDSYAQHPEIYTGRFESEDFSKDAEYERTLARRVDQCIATSRLRISRLRSDLEKLGADPSA